MRVEARPAIAVEELTTVEALERLRPEWRQLWARCDSATPFQSPEWLLPWWRHFGGGELCALTLRQAERLVGLAPFWVRTNPQARTCDLLLLGTGITDYLDVLVDPEAEADTTAAMFSWLARERERWDVCDFQQLRPGSPLLDSAFATNWRGEIAVQERCPVLALAAAGELVDRSPALWEKARYYWRRAARIGPLCMEEARRDNFEELFMALLRLHHCRWEARNSPGVLAEEAVQNFHREAALGLLARGALRLYGLRLAGRIVASYYGFAAGRRAYYYLGGFDPELTQLSLGTLMVAHAIQEAINESAREFDFLRGAEAYKYRWGATDRLNYRRRLWAK